MKIVAIHQPNFFPWLGYFDKIRRADVFVVLDDVQFQKTGGTWSNRVKMMVGGQPQWVTMPIIRSYHGVLPYRQVRINDQTGWREKFLRTISTNYHKSPFYNEIYPQLEALVGFDTTFLAEFNLNTIQALSGSLALHPGKIMLQSALAITGAATDLLIKLTKEVEGTAYLCGMGALGYQEDQKFIEAGIDLIYQDFQHPVYPQTSNTEFSPGLSIIDALMNCGYAGTSVLMQNSSIKGSG